LLPTALLITHPDAPLMRPCAFRIGHLTRTAAQACTLHAMLCRAWIKGVRSNERKARDGAEILTEGLGLSKYTVVTGLGENDRSATGFLNKEEFEAAVDAFFCSAAYQCARREDRGRAPGANFSCSRGAACSTSRRLSAVKFDPLHGYKSAAKCRRARRKPGSLSAQE